MCLLICELNIYKQLNVRHNLYAAFLVISDNGEMGGGANLIESENV